MSKACEVLPRARCLSLLEPFYIKLVRRSQSSGRKEDVYVRICMDGTQYDHFLLPRRESGVTCKAWQNGDGDVMPFMWCRRTDMGLRGDANMPRSTKLLAPNRRPRPHIFITKNPADRDPKVVAIQTHYAHLGDEALDDFQLEVLRISAFQLRYLSPLIITAIFSYKESVLLNGRGGSSGEAQDRARRLDMRESRILSSSPPRPIKRRQSSTSPMVLHTNIRNKGKGKESYQEPPTNRQRLSTPGPSNAPRSRGSTSVRARSIGLEEIEIMIQSERKNKMFSDRRIALLRKMKDNLWMTQNKSKRRPKEPAVTDLTCNLEVDEDIEQSS
ncbi:unnamed protein product [Somion occarium]|uniref:Uncharacterized protein n=1 Tax=Somion occarium TaxID=3059160 RepID=A0ABP1CST1_9APHY